MILKIYLIIIQIIIMNYKRVLIITGGAGFIGSHVKSRKSPPASQRKSIPTPKT